MTDAPSLVTDTVHGEQMVRAPRTTDAIGVVLRDAFGRTSMVPFDMVELVSQVDHVELTRH